MSSESSYSESSSNEEPLPRPQRRRPRAAPAARAPVARARDASPSSSSSDDESLPRPRRRPRGAPRGRGGRRGRGGVSPATMDIYGPPLQRRRVEGPPPPALRPSEVQRALVALRSALVCDVASRASARSDVYEMRSMAVPLPEAQIEDCVEACVEAWGRADEPLEAVDAARMIQTIDEADLGALAARDLALQDVGPRDPDASTDAMAAKLPFDARSVPFHIDLVSALALKGNQLELLQGEQRPRLQRPKTMRQQIKRSTPNDPRTAAGNYADVSEDFDAVVEGASKRRAGADEALMLRFRLHGWSNARKAAKSHDLPLMGDVEVLSTSTLAALQSLVPCDCVDHAAKLAVQTQDLVENDEDGAAPRSPSTPKTAIADDGAFTVDGAVIGNASTPLDEVKLRLGGIVSLTHIYGTCDHSLVLVSARLVARDRFSKFPRYRAVGKRAKARQCDVCGTYSAKFASLDDTMASENPAVFCEGCLHMLHYTDQGHFEPQNDADNRHLRLFPL
ncbi:snRNA-activating protein of 50kDa MW C terminal-domain-containing protein [Pelagophyceae sp. CCMP2097]|nr:snRNA-activating protein of 50kDa MW C terminal-domain-containing protein [Pelagophyceae sp. CCMP2097]